MSSLPKVEFYEPRPAVVRVNPRAVTAAVIGNALEFYDFLCYATFAVAIGHSFFPVHDPLASLLLSLATFGVGFVTRPLGGVLIGTYADRVGRRAALTLNIALMAVGTLAIALTPGYASIGVAAPVILVVARLIQGLSLGGEVGPATAVLLESAPAGRRAQLGSWQGISQGLASLLAGLLALLLGSLLPAAALEGWGWRVPFLLGLLIVPIGIYIRRHLPETAVLPQDRPAHPLGLLWRDHAGLLFQGVLSIMAATVSTYIGLYMTTYALTTLHLPAGSAAWGTIANSLGVIVGAAASGWAADRWGWRLLIVTPRLVFLLLVYPAFLLLTAMPVAPVLAAVSFCLAVLGSGSGMTVVTALAAAFPRTVRGSGLAISYALSVSLFGGTTQFVVAWLIGATGNPLAPAWYAMATSCISLLALMRLPMRPVD